MITGLAHVNLSVPAGTLGLAREFYGDTLGLAPRPVPQLQKDSLAWFDIASSGQQVHIAHGREVDFASEHALTSPRHPCFKLETPEKLLELQRRIWTHFEKGGESAPRECDRPGGENSGDKGVEYPTRFFARDYAGNRLEFSL
ncbi:hypothetical protein QBC46DRAFT_386360 [Diplogelasinospora grovesii]|uniref:Glyoxalase family protein n=1 Tax=Diplogelasinospora grovesii TaxID=303347 RepID=A0AAN6S498_9PEZI|nr:hypothetical protein QBC46DRAFT_386360 [Diplogelasinospora grovesii]